MFISIKPQIDEAVEGDQELQGAGAWWTPRACSRDAPGEIRTEITAEDDPFEARREARTPAEPGATPPPDTFYHASVRRYAGQAGGARQALRNGEVSRCW